MKKTMICAAALLLAGTVLTACSGGDDVTSDITPVSQPAAEAGDVVELSGTLGSKGSVTRAIDADGNGTWEVGDKFAVYYETANGHASTVATVNSVYSDGSANFKATLRSPKTGDNSVKLVYPASAHNGEGGFKTDGLMNQGGTLEYINQNGLDIETATTTMNVEGMTAKLKNDVTMQPQVCLHTMNIKDEQYQTFDNIITKLEITNDKGQSYTITPTSATNSFTIAMLPVSGAKFTFTATTTKERGFYTKLDGFTLADCTADNVGDVFDENGVIYKVSSGSGALYTNYSDYNSTSLSAGKFYTSIPRFIAAPLPTSPGVAMIAYVGEKGSVETGSEYRGLAIAIKDCTKDNCSLEEYGGVSWCTQTDETCTSEHSADVEDAREWKDGIIMTSYLFEHSTDAHNHWAVKAAKTYDVPYPSGTSGWFLASLGQWQLIMQGLITKGENLTEPYSEPITTSRNPKMTYTYLDQLILNKAGTSFGPCYWSSSEYDEYDGWCVAPSVGNACTEIKNTHNFHVRAVIAF